MFESLKKFWFKWLYKIFGYSRPFPKDGKPLPPRAEIVKEIEEFIAEQKKQNKQIDAEILQGGAKKKKEPAVQGVCVVHFTTGGGTACSPSLRGGYCDGWGDKWEKRGFPNWCQTEKSCPAGSERYP